MTMLLSSENLDTFTKNGYVVVDSFLPDIWAQKLSLRAVELYQSQQLQQAKVGQGGQQRLAQAVRGDLISWIKDSTVQPEEIYFLNQLRSLQDLLNREFFLALRRSEAHFACYPPGSQYQKHWDNFQGKNSRLVTFVYYMNENWQEPDGGELRLYNPQDESQLLCKVNPLFNRCILFKSQEFPHEVGTAHKLRKSLTGWMRTDDESTFT